MVCVWVNPLVAIYVQKPGLRGVTCHCIVCKVMVVLAYHMLGDGCRAYVLTDGQIMNGMVL